MKTVTVEYVASISTTDKIINNVDTYTIDDAEVSQIDRIITDIGALEIKLYNLRPDTKYSSTIKIVLYAPKVWKKVTTNY